MTVVKFMFLFRKLSSENKKKGCLAMGIVVVSKQIKELFG